jgi:alkanesulfonate monooxygenase SsuD/methylene tetrahydromethanopterin reductase-like flavin-dependent oxidoreductase (luciferase family)
MNGKLRIGIFDWVEASDTRSPGEVYAHKLALAEAADKAGLHSYLLAEHQGTPLSIDASPSVLLSAMIQRTKSLRVGALTFCLPWYDAYRFYGEVCMLDQLSGGRLELGVGRGVSPIESQIFGMQNIEHSREKYRETLDVFFAACASDTLNYSGKYYQYKDVELHVKPVQKPYPPLWFPSSNKDSVEFTARHGYHTAFLGPLGQCKPHFDHYREVWQAHRGDAGRHNAHVAEPFLAKTQHLVIAQNDAEAEEIGLRAYGKWASHIHHLTRKLGRPDVHKNDPYAEDSAHRLITGSPRLALERLQEMLSVTSANYLLCVFSFGDIAPAHAMRSLELFTREVKPKLSL